MDFYTMLDELYDSLGAIISDKLILPNPIIEKGTTRVVWKNIKDFLKTIRTPPDHLFDFISKTSNQKINWYSDSVSDGLIIHYNRISTNDISGWMKKYINDFVICRICKKANTSMIRNSEIRKYFIKCDDCNSEYCL